MRLSRLDLTRYGHFTDRTLDFGPRPAGPDFHIVHGPNEAGKSTLLEAWLDLLYGIELRSPYDFLHSSDTLRLGALLDLPGGAVEIQRVKKRKDDGLIGPDGAASQLARALGGIDRAAYRTMFALNDASIEEGGDAILSSQGDLGELLFSASAGLSELGRRLDTLRQRGEAFYKKQARKTRLALARHELEDLAAQKAALEVRADEYAALRRAADEAVRALHEARAGHAAALRAATLARGRKAALPLLGQWRAAAAQLAPLEPLPEAPPEWSARIGELIREDVLLDAQIGTAERQRAELAAALAALVTDPAALAQADAARHAAGLRARQAAALRDLPQREAELGAIEAELRDLTAQLGRPGDAPATLRIDAATIDAIDLLLRERESVAARLDLARAERRAARQRLEAAGGPPADRGEEHRTRAAALERALDAARRGDPVQRLKDAEAAAADAAARAGDALAQLSPWQGDGAALAALAVPGPQTLAAWRARAEAAASALGTARRMAADRIAGLQAADAALAGAEAALGDAGPAPVAEARAERDAAWAEHRARLDAASADRFAASMGRHDAAVAAQLAAADAVARLNAARAQRAQAALALQQAEAAAGAAASAQAAEQAALAALVGALLPGAGAEALADLPLWLDRRQAALAACADARQAQRTAERARAGLDAAAASLRSLVGEAGDLPALIAAAEAALHDSRSQAQRDAERTALAAALQQREDAAAEAQAAEQDWLTRWRAGLAASWLAAGAQPAEVGPLLAALRRLDGLAGQAAERRSVIAALKRDEQDFAAAMTALQRALDPAAQVPDPVAALAAAEARIAAAQAAAAEAQRLERALSAADAELARLTQVRAALDAEAQAMRRHLGAADLGEVQRILAQLHRRSELRRSIDDLSRPVCEHLECADLAAAEAALAGSDAAALAQAVAEAEVALTGADAAREQAQQAALVARMALDAVGSDAAAARIEAQRRTLLLDIEDGARRWLRLRAGVLAADRALARYRDSHRSGMLARASAAFAAMTGGAWSGLDTQPGPKGEILIAQTAAGASRQAHELSDGTRYQLYLALRIAGFHEYAAAHGTSVPIIADDVMEKFDDDRTPRALAALAETARHGQVIYLTHHAHVVDMARQACPEVRVHAL